VQKKLDRKLQIYRDAVIKSGMHGSHRQGKKSGVFEKGVQGQSPRGAQELGAVVLLLRLVFCLDASQFVSFIWQKYKDQTRKKDEKCTAFVSSERLFQSPLHLPTVPSGLNNPGRPDSTSKRMIKGA